MNAEPTPQKPPRLWPGIVAAALLLPFKFVVVPIGRVPAVARGRRPGGEGIGTMTRTRNTHARLAGFMFLLYISTGVAEVISLKVGEVGRAMRTVTVRLYLGPFVVSLQAPRCATGESNEQRAD